MAKYSKKFHFEIDNIVMFVQCTALHGVLVDDDINTLMATSKIIIELLLTF